jgi:hypothetical protein
MVEIPTPLAEALKERLRIDRELGAGGRATSCTGTLRMGSRLSAPGMNPVNLRVCTPECCETSPESDR